MLWAISCRREDIVRLLLSHGADIHCSVRGRGVCFMVANFGYLPMLCILVEAGADIEMQDFNGRSPLYVACENRFISIVRELIR